MAKMFYSKDEMQEKLGRSAEEITELVSQGLLREFRDGAKLMFKVDEVDNLAQATSDDSDGAIELRPLSDSAEAAAQTEGGGSGESDQFDLNLDESGSAIGLAPVGESGDQINLDDSGATEPATKDDTVITSADGVNVLGDSDSELELDVDPMAQTQIAPDLADQVHLDSGASGSGLLDLTREADDTSLGAELLEEIYPGTEEGAIETQVPSSLDVPEQSAPQSVMAEQAVAEPTIQFARAAAAIDPSSGAWGAMMVIPLIFLVVLACVAGAGVTGVEPSFLVTLSGINWYVVPGAVVLSLVVLFVGSMVSKQAGAPGKPKSKSKAKKKAAKPKKSKKK